jgi:putative ABC transport system permease protein
MLTSLVLAYRSIAKNRARAALTVLGILIGVGALIAVTALSRGVTTIIDTSFDAFASNGLTVTPFAPPNQRSKTSGTPRLTELDARAIWADAPNVTKVAPFLGSTTQIIYGDHNENSEIVGTSPAYLEIRKMRVREGAVWSEGDDVDRAKVCLIGSSIARSLFGRELSPIGQTVRLNRSAFRVIGVLAERGASLFGSDPDKIILIPINTFRASVKHTAPLATEKIYVAADASVERAQAQITTILRDRHHIPRGLESDFTIATQTQTRQVAFALTTTLGILLFSVAAVSLVVGGVGVMNIMLVSVAERTREIGIRLSIGARARDILLQFLAEAVALSLLGGLSGLACGSAVTHLLGRAFDVEIYPDVGSVVLAIGTSVVIGVTSGYVPARRAAGLDPIQALRTE